MPVVYAASDLHGNLPDVPADAELLLLAGDICPDFKPWGRMAGSGYVDTSGLKQARWLDNEFRAWLEGHGVPTVATWGNHDFVGQTPHWPLRKPLPLTMLKDQEVTVEGVRVYGTPWVPGLPYWAFYGSPEALSARADLIPEGLDVLMSHGPPFRYGDYIPTSEKQRNKYGNFGGKNVGDPALSERIYKAQPATVICGHIHEARGAYKMRWSTVYNVAAVNEVYELHDDPFVRLDLGHLDP